MPKSTASNTTTSGYDPHFGTRVSEAYRLSLERDRRREKAYGTVVAVLTRRGGTPPAARALYNVKKCINGQLGMAYQHLRADEREGNYPGSSRGWVEDLESRRSSIETLERDLAARLWRELLGSDEDEAGASLEKLAMTADSQAPDAGPSHPYQPSLSASGQPSMVERPDKDAGEDAHEHPTSTSPAKNTSNGHGVSFRSPSLN